MKSLHLAVASALALMLALPLGGRAASSGPQIGPSATTDQDIGDSNVEAKDPYLATIFSILPGVVIHGSGNFYAEDFTYGSEMLVMEILGGGFAIWGYNLIHENPRWSPYFGNESPQAGYWVEAAGVGLLTVSWVGDVATAPGAATNWNQDHQLELQMDSFNLTGVRLSLSTKF